MASSLDYLQPILGTSKKNPVFSLHQHSQTKDYHLYYGLELFEVVPSDREDIRFKLMLAHLHNAGVALIKLQEVFGLDPRTILGWSRALKSGNAEKLARALAGRSAGRKLTRPLEQYVRIRFPYVYAYDKRSYSRTIRAEIKQLFDVELSGETLRPLFTELRAELDPSSATEAPAEEPDAPRQRDDEDDDQPPPSSSRAPNDTTASNPEKPSQAEGQAGPALQTTAEPLGALKSDKLCVPPHRNQSADFGWCSHLGLLLFAQPLDSLRQALGTEGPAVCQWASQVLLGAANLEQTKLLSGRDLALLLGDEVLGTPGHQRVKLSQLAADNHLVRRILCWNFQRLNGAERRDFYFDPHVKHYTGQQNVLKGWCSKLRWADKVINMDFAHTTEGHPIYVENTDNYDDMRQRFHTFQTRFRQTLGLAAEAELTWTIDRGIYAMEIFDRVAADPFNHLVTWEKNYQRDGWPEGKACDGSLSMERPRNHAADLKTYTFEWIEQPWPKSPAWRQIIVRATNPVGNTVEVSILCDDAKRPAGELVWLMFDRWVQENDFKYLDEHFGLNEITSYHSQTYDEIREELEDREMKNAAFTALEKARIDLKHKLGQLLVLDKQADKKEQTRIRSLTQLEAMRDTGPSHRLKLGRLKGAGRSAQVHREKRKNRADQIEKEIEEIECRLQSTGREVSRLDTLVGKQAVRLCGERKHLMDVIKITARNMFYEMIGPFKEAYNNFRDDHVWFRHLLRSGGVIELQPDQSLRCHLVGADETPKPVQKVLEKHLHALNQTRPHLPQADERDFELLLTPKSAIQFAFLNPI